MGFNSGFKGLIDKTVLRCVRMSVNRKLLRKRNQEIVDKFPSFWGSVDSNKISQTSVSSGRFELSTLRLGGRICTYSRATFLYVLWIINENYAVMQQCPASFSQATLKLLRI